MSYPGVYFWSSTSGNTRKFVDRACGDDVHPCRIGSSSPDPQQAVSPFVLVMPTYAGHDGAGAVPKPVIRFLNDPINRAFLMGVIGSGNRNFGSLFCLGARVVAQKCNVPLLHRFELTGLQEDVDIFRDLMGLPATGTPSFRSLAASVSHIS